MTLGRNVLADMDPNQESPGFIHGEDVNEQIKSMGRTITDLAKDKEELEHQLREQPIDVPATVEKVPEEVERELEGLRKKSGIAKFEVHFDGLVKGFDALLKALGELPEQDQAKYKEVVLKLMDKMSERL